MKDTFIIIIIIIIIITRLVIRHNYVNCSAGLNRRRRWSSSVVARYSQVLATVYYVRSVYVRVTALSGICYSGPSWQQGNYFTGYHRRH